MNIFHSTLNFIPDNNMCIDLHVHSIYSDGTNTPEQLIHLARKAGLAAIALTDHDTVAGVEEMLYLGEEHNIKVISGVEISCMHKEVPVHILGYGIDHTNEEFLNWISHIQNARVERNKHIVANLQGIGIDVEFSELTRYSKVGQTGRPHIARLLVEKKVVTSMDQAFRQYLRRGAAAWASRKVYSAEEAVAVIHRAGGLAVLAHPGTMNRSHAVQVNIIGELSGLGLDGVEMYYPSHTKKIIRRLKKIVQRYNLISTGGSDYHGGNHSGVFMAGWTERPCPPECLLEHVLVGLQRLKKSQSNATLIS